MSESGSESEDGILDPWAREDEGGVLDPWASEDDETGSVKNPDNEEGDDIEGTDSDDIFDPWAAIRTETSVTDDESDGSEDIVDPWANTSDDSRDNVDPSMVDEKDRGVDSADPSRPTSPPNSGYKRLSEDDRPRAGSVASLRKVEDGTEMTVLVLGMHGNDHLAFVEDIEKFSRIVDSKGIYDHESDSGISGTSIQFTLKDDLGDCLKIKCSFITVDAEHISELDDLDASAASAIVSVFSSAPPEVCQDYLSSQLDWIHSQTSEGNIYIVCSDELALKSISAFSNLRVLDLTAHAAESTVIPQFLKELTIDNTVSPRFQLRDALGALSSSLHLVSKHWKQTRQQLEDEYKAVRISHREKLDKKYDLLRKLGEFQRELADLNTTKAEEIFYHKYEYTRAKFGRHAKIPVQIQTDFPIFHVEVDGGPGASWDYSCVIGTPEFVGLFTSTKRLQSEGWGEVRLFTDRRHRHAKEIQVLEKIVVETTRLIEEVKGDIEFLSKLQPAETTWLDHEEELIRQDIAKLRTTCSTKWNLGSIREILRLKSYHSIAQIFGITRRLVPELLASHPINGAHPSLLRAADEVDVLSAGRKLLEAAREVAEQAKTSYQEVYHIHRLLLETPEVTKTAAVSTESTAKVETICRDWGEEPPKERSSRIIHFLSQRTFTKLQQSFAEQSRIKQTAETQLSKSTQLSRAFSEAQEHVEKVYVDAYAYFRICEKLTSYGARKEKNSLGIFTSLMQGETAEEAFSATARGEYLLQRSSDQRSGTRSSLLESNLVPPHLLNNANRHPSNETSPHATDPPFKCKCTSPEERNVLFVGTTQSGKSSTIRSIMDYAGITDPECRPGVGNGNRSETNEVKIYKVVIPLHRPVAAGQSRAADVFNDEFKYGLQYEDDGASGILNFRGRDDSGLIWSEFSGDELDELQFRPSDADIQSSHIHLNLIDTPGLNDTESLHRSQLLALDEATSQSSMNVVDEEHKVKILKALHSIGNISSVCFVVDSKGSFGDAPTKLLEFYGETFRVSGIRDQAHYHVIHTKVAVDDMFKGDVQSRKGAIHRILKDSAQHHFFDNLIHDQNGPSKRQFIPRLGYRKRAVLRHSVWRILSLLDVEPKGLRSPNTSIKYTKNTAHRTNDQILQLGYGRLLQELEREIGSQQAQLEGLYGAKLVQEKLLSVARNAAHSYAVKIADHDRNEKQLLVKEAPPRQENSFFDWNPQLRFTVTTAQVTIRDIEYSPSYLDNRWLGSTKSGGIGYDYYSITFRANTFETAAAEIRVFGWKSEIYAKEIREWKEDRDKRFADASNCEKEVARIDASVASIQTRIEQLRSRKDLAHSEKEHLRAEGFEASGTSWDVKFELLATGNLLCAAKAYGLRSSIKVEAILPDGKKTIENYEAAIKSELDMLFNISQTLASESHEAQALRRHLDDVVKLAVQQLEERSALSLYMHENLARYTTRGSNESCEAYYDCLKIFSPAIDDQNKALRELLGDLNGLRSSVSRLISDLDLQLKATQSQEWAFSRFLCVDRSEWSKDEIDIGIWTVLQESCRRNSQAAETQASLVHPVVVLVYSLSKLWDLQKF